MLPYSTFDILKTAVDKGVNFLAKNQTSSGEFITLRAEDESFQKSEPVSSIFITSFILHSLKYLNYEADLQKIINPATIFLLRNREPNGFWRFFGNCDERYAPDLDDTCCVLASLRGWNVRMNYHQMAQHILQYKREDGSFWTWAFDKDSPTWWRNDVDWVVNANVLFFFSLLGYTMPDTEQYLRSIVSQQVFKQSTIYYGFPVSFIYCLTRAIVDGRTIGLTDVLTEIHDYLSTDLCLDNPLEKVLRVASLINIGKIKDGNQNIIEDLLSLQTYDGGWPVATFFHEPPNYRYGSRELTTAIAIECIVKYIHILKGKICI